MKGHASNTPARAKGTVADISEDLNYGQQREGIKESTLTGFQISLFFQWTPIFQIALASGMENMGEKYVQESDLRIWVKNMFRNLVLALGP